MMLTLQPRRAANLASRCVEVRHVSLAPFQPLLVIIKAGVRFVKPLVQVHQNVAVAGCVPARSVFLNVGGHHFHELVALIAVASFE